MADKNEVVITIRIDDQGAVTMMDQLGRKIEETRDQSKSASDSFLDYAASIAKVGAGVLGATTALAGLAAGGVAVLGNLAQQGAGLNDLEETFNSLSAKAGVLSDTLLNDLSTAFGGTVTNAELMQSANKALLAGLDPQIFDEVANSARAYADAVGTDAKQEFDAFLQGLARGDDRFLKQRGILIDNNKAFEEYAAKIGTTADKLSELGKAEALKEASTRALLEQSEKLGKVQNDVGDAYAALTTAVGNAKNQFLQAIGTNQNLKTTFEDLAEQIKDFDFDPLLNGLSAVLALLAKIPAAVNAASIGLQAIVGQGGGRFDQQLIDTIGAQSKTVSTTIDSINKSLPGVSSNDELKAVAEKLNTLRDSLAGVTEEVRAKFAPALGVLEQMYLNQAKLVGDVVKTEEKHKKGLIDTAKAQDEAKKKSKELADSIKSLSEITATAAGIDRFPKLTEQIIDAFSRENVIGAQGVATELQKIGEIALRAGVPLEEVKKHIDEITKTKDDMAEWALSVEKDTEDALDAAAQAAEDFNQQLAGTISEGLTSAIKSAISGDKEGIKSSLRGLGGDLGGTFAAGLGESILPGIGGQILGPIGEALGDALGKGVFDSFNHVFGGGRNAESEARKKVDAFLAEVFDTERLSVLIDRQLTEVFDLNFGKQSFRDGTFDDLFAGLPAAAQQAFGAVGQALDSLLETGEGISGQLSAVLANGLGGSLNNLQIALSTLPYSFEQMGEAIEAAALKGQISFSEAQADLIGLQKLAEKGIPDAFGDTTQAFQNLLDAGSKGGRVTVDALQDIAAEAKELGLGTIPELQAQLTASGKFTEEQITGLFQSLTDNGIDSLDELLNASNETIIAILSELQSKDILTEAQQQAMDLIDTINQIPERKDVEINLKVNASNADRDALNQVDSIARSG